MTTVTISKKEYDALVFAKLGPNKKTKKSFNMKGFGVLKDSFGKESSVSIVRKMRKDWR